MINERVILHIDINYCYAQIEEMLFPAFKDIPLAVAGSVEARHGIILTKNLKASKTGIKVAEPIWQALKKCPDLYVVKPRMKLYQYYTDKVKDIYREYSDKIEDFGLDEAWVDVTHTQHLFGTPFEIAKEIQTRVLDELGLTVSIGVSFNKVFAKIGSDLTKPSGLHIITKENFRDKLWYLPCETMIMVGPATKRKLNDMNIFTLGELANANVYELRKVFGKIGPMLYNFANGAEMGEVSLSQYKEKPKSIGNSWTTPKDIKDMHDARIVLERLCESVASRLRKEGLCGCIVTISLRNKELKGFSHQKRLDEYIDVKFRLLEIAMYLLKECYADFPIPLRSIGIGVSSLKPTQTYMQYDLFGDNVQKRKDRSLEIVSEEIRNKFGFYKLKRASMLLDEQLSNVNPQGSHTVFPVGFLKGAIK